MLVLASASVVALRGNVFAPLFALAESAAMAFALSVAWRAGDRGERLALDAAALEVRYLPGARRARFPTYWVRVRLEPVQGRQRLLLSSHGREVEIGAFLADAERVELSRKLTALLVRLRTAAPLDGQQRCTT